ncbi:hypothetical protein JNW88_03685 [Micromonospora sp. ATA32]|nr:hypothetical protein [Micromonospora sp. ATA32]
MLDRLMTLVVTAALALTCLGAPAWHEIRSVPTLIAAAHGVPVTRTPVETSPLAGRVADRPAGTRADPPGAYGLLPTPSGDHTAGSATADAPDHPVLGPPTRAIGALVVRMAPPRYRPPTPAMPAGESVASRAPPTHPA